MSLGVNHIDKQEFLLLYQQARTQALHESNIRSGFAATGLVPYEPDRVLSLLHTQLHTPSPQLQPQADPSPYTAATPHNITELQQQTELISQYIKRHSHSPPSMLTQAVNQVIKGASLVMESIALLTDQNEKLMVENQRQKRKKAQQRVYIAKEGILTGADAQELIDNRRNSTLEVVPDRQGQGRQRALPKCSLCSSLKHKAPKCPRYQRIS
jgi:hypothetical protein